MLIAQQQALPVGRVLIMAQFITENSLQAAVQAQSLLKDGQVALEMAIDALKLTDAEHITLEIALCKVGWSDKSPSATNKLGELLIESEVITAEDLEQGLVQCNMSGLPLGRVLVSMGMLNEQLLSSALNAQILIRDEKISRQQAVQGLRASKERQISIEESLTESGLQIGSKQSVRLGELLVLAKLIQDNDIMESVERGLVEEKPIGEVLVDQGLIQQSTLDSALEVQKRVGTGEIAKDVSGKILAMVCNEGIAIDEAAKKVAPVKPEVTIEELPLYQFLQLAGLITPKDIEKALKLGSRNTELMAKMLLLAEALDASMLDSAIRLHRLVAVGALKADQSLMAMGICQNRKCTLEQAFKSLGWSIPDADGQLTAESVEALKRTTGQFKALTQEDVQAQEERPGQHVSREIDGSVHHNRDPCAQQPKGT